MAIRLATKKEAPYCSRAESKHDREIAFALRHYKPSIMIDIDAPRREREARLGKVPQKLVHIEACLIEIIAKHASYMRHPLKTIGTHEGSKYVDYVHAENDAKPAWTKSEIDGKYAGMQKTGKMMLELLEKEIPMGAILEIVNAPGAHSGFDRVKKTDCELCGRLPETANLQKLAGKLRDLAGDLITFAQATASMGAAGKIMTQVTLLSYYCGLCSMIEEKGLKGYFEYSDEIKKRESKSASIFANNYALKKLEGTYRPMWKAGIYD